MAAVALAAPAETHATGSLITVNVLNDLSPIGDGQCSLREAIVSANLNIGNTNNDCADGQGGERDLILFDGGGTISLTGNLPSITDAVEIDGAGDIVIDGQGSTPFTVISGGLVLSNATLENGFGAFGGAITNGSIVFLSKVTVRGNGANYGGGIHNNGTMSISQSTIEGNTANLAGGGIFNEGTLTLKNVTIAGNSSPEGGGLYSNDTTTIDHTTITRNTATTGAGIDVTAGTTSVFSSIVAGNTGAAIAGSTTTAYSVVASSASGVLDSRGLRDNGGPTKTIVLSTSTSNPALKIGDPDWCNFAGYVDQRGLARPSGNTDKCDAGAVERDRIAPSMTSGPTTKLRSGVALSGSSLRARISWAGKDNATGAGIDHYALARSVNGGSWTTVSSSLTGTAANATLANGKTYRFRTRAVDHDGNASAWRYGPTFTARLVQQSSSSVTFGSGWSSVSSTKYSGGSTRYTTASGKSVRLSFTGRGVALVTTLRTNGGSVKVYLDGTLVDTIALTAGSATYRVQVAARAMSGSTSHTLRVVTSGPGRVDIDGFAVLR